MAIKELEPKWWKGEYLYFEDKGPLSKGSKTRIYRVKTKDQFLGVVKWMSAWRRYSFYGEATIIHDEHLTELAEFCKMMTDLQKVDWRQRSVIDWELVKSWKTKDQVTHVDGN